MGGVVHRATLVSANDDINYMDILNGVKEFRDGVMNHIELAAKELEKMGKKNDKKEVKKESKRSGSTKYESTDKSDPSTALTIKDGKKKAKKMRDFSSTWFSLLGWSTGITGLIKDFIGNYFGQSGFHNKNGSLINSIKNLAYVLTRKDRNERFGESMREFIKTGKSIFNKDGALKDLFKHMQTLFTDNAVLEAFLLKKVASVESNASFKILRQAFDFLVTDKRNKPVPSDDEDDSWKEQARTRNSAGNNRDTDPEGEFDEL